MDTRCVLKRLLWRESRENGLFLLSGVLLSVFSLVMRSNENDSTLRQAITPMVLMLLSLLVSMWAISRGSATRRRLTFDFRHLPLAPRLDAAVSLLLPVGIVTLIGAGIGFWGAVAFQYREFSCFVWLGIACLVGNFTSCYLLSATAALLPAVLLAAAWILPTALMQDIFLKQIGHPLFIAEVFPYYTSIALGALGGMCVSIALTRRMPSLTGRVSAMLLLCALPLGTLIIKYRQSNPTNEQTMETTLQDSALLLVLDYHAQSTTLEFTDHRKDFHTTRDFAGRIVPCGRDSQGDVLLLQQSPHETCVRLLCWTPHTDQLREEVDIPAGSGVLEVESYRLDDCGSLSPDNRYLLLLLKIAVEPVQRSLAHRPPAETGETAATEYW